MPLTPASTSTRAAAVTLAVLLALAAGCASKPEVRHDQDPTVDLRAFKTFAFYDAAALPQTHYAALIERRLKQTTREQLERQAYVYSESNPDLRVNLRLVVRDQQEIRSTPGGRGFYGYRGWSSPNFETVDYRHGTLAIDLVDARRNALVWHGVAEGRLDAKATEQPGPAISAAVSEIFAQLPGAQPAAR